MRYQISRTLPSPRREGYEYLTDLTKWSEWSPIQIVEPESAKLSKPGDVVSYVYKPLGLPMKGSMALLERTPGEKWRVRFQQRAFMDIEMTWSFENAGAHAFTIDVDLEIDDSEWWDKTYEWISMMPMWIKRDIRRALDTLHEHFAHPEVEKEAVEAS